MNRPNSLAFQTITRIGQVRKETIESLKRSRNQLKTAYNDLQEEAIAVKNDNIITAEELSAEIARLEEAE